MRRFLSVAALACLTSISFTLSSTQAADLEYKPIDTSKYLVQPTDVATGFLSNVTRAVSRVTAGMIDNNGYVKTVNNLFRSSPSMPAPQSNGLPSPSLYPGAAHRNSFTPRMPTTQQYR